MNRYLVRAQHFVFRDFLPIAISLFTVFLIGRIYEWALLFINHGSELLTVHYLLAGIGYDLAFSLILSILLSLISSALKSLNPNIIPGVVSSIITLLGIIEIVLITFFNATLIPLGADFWAYSGAEIMDTVSASNQITVGAIILLITFGIIFFAITAKLLRNQYSKGSKKILLNTFVGIFLISCTYLLVNDQSDANGYTYKQNKLAYFIDESVDFDFFASSASAREIPVKKEFPFLHAPSPTDKLSPFFDNTSQPPNIVFIIMESLGGEFIGTNGQWTGFAPYLDSLSQQSLYWENGLSLSGRTFGVMPSLLGSLPPVDDGFMNLGPEYPNHLTLINMLGARGYHTSFYSGYDTYFDDLNYFLDFNSIDFILNKQKLDDITGGQNNEANYWGYDDKMMFRVASQILDTTSITPRLEIYHTLQSHSPFTVPNPEKYDQKFENRLAKLNISKSRKEKYRLYRKELKSLLYSDEALREFINGYQQRDDFKNTIFIITGDHWLIPVPQTSSISRYHVPIIIWSPLLKKAVRFKSVNTHANVAPSIANYLKNSTTLSLPPEVSWIGQPLDTTRSFRNIHSIPLMKNKKQITDFISGKYYLQENQLFRLRDNLELEIIDDPITKTKLENELKAFKTRSNYAVTRDKLYPDSVSKSLTQKYAYIARFDTLFQRIDSKNLNPDQQFQLARQKAFDNKYEQARAICKRLLMRYPNFHDARLLWGRTHAWEGDYEEAKKIYLEVKQKAPEYPDTYNALADLERWSGNPQKALTIINEGLEYHPDLLPLLEKKIKILGILQRTSEAKDVYKKMKKLHSGHQTILEFEKYL